MMLCCTQSCSKYKYPFDRAGLTYRNKLVYNNQFRIDGFYHDIIDDERVQIRYFFLDGIYCEFDIDVSLLLSLNNNEFIDINEKIRKLPYCWGAYIIENDIVKVQVYDSYQGVDFKVQEEQWKILNDTTITLFKRVAPNGNVYDFNETYHFKYCEHKPDSTNVLMGYSSSVANVDNYRLGTLSFGYKGYRIGVNSEGIRHVFQNQFVHSSIKPQSGFIRTSCDYKPYFHYGTKNKYTLW
ncbi:MAG: hypothetical protein LBT48_01745 [Prevotellaceae bacterium]|nr:hypothetical protein [Prevotellaceae bacterium]